MDLYSTQRFLKNELESQFTQLSFEFEIKDNSADAKGNFTLQGQDVSIFFHFFESGAFMAMAMFDEMELDMQVAELLNTVNSNASFTVYVDDYLTVGLQGHYYNEADAGKIAVDFMIDLVDLTEEEDFQELLELL